MITELKQSEFAKCQKLLNKQGQIEAAAVISGVNPGRVFVDNQKQPTSGLIWLGNNDGFIFIGDENNKEFNEDFNTLIDHVIIPEARKVGLTWFEGVGNHSNWNPTIEKLLNNRKLGSWSQKVYRLHKDDYQSYYEPALNHDYQVVRIDGTLFENADCSIKNIKFLHSKIMEFWSSLEEFFQTGFGYCIVSNNEIVSVCFSGFVVGNVHCIDIETLASHSGKKLAQTIAHSFVRECMEYDLVPYWDCMESNKPSVAIAEKLGFRNTFTYVGYEFPLE